MTANTHSLFLKTLERSYLLKINSKGKNRLCQLKVLFKSQGHGSEQGLRRQISYLVEQSSKTVEYWLKKGSNQVTHSL